MQPILAVFQLDVVHAQELHHPIFLAQPAILDITSQQPPQPPQQHAQLVAQIVFNVQVLAALCVLQGSLYPLMPVYPVELLVVTPVQLPILVLPVLIHTSLPQTLLEVPPQLHAINVQLNVPHAHLQVTSVLHVPMDMYSKMVVVSYWPMLIVLTLPPILHWLPNKHLKLLLDVLFVTMDSIISTIDVFNQFNLMQEYLYLIFLVRICC